VVVLEELIHNPFSKCSLEEVLEDQEWEAWEVWVVWEEWVEALKICSLEECQVRVEVVKEDKNKQVLHQDSNLNSVDRLQFYLITLLVCLN
jgi:hypothetical protein